MWTDVKLEFSIIFVLIAFENENQRCILWISADAVLLVCLKVCSNIVVNTKHFDGNGSGFCIA